MIELLYTMPLMVVYFLCTFYFLRHLSEHGSNGLPLIKEQQKEI